MTLLTQVRDLGVPARAARTAALCQPVPQAPAPVVADAFGYHHLTAQYHRGAAGGTGSHYASMERDR